MRKSYDLGTKLFHWLVFLLVAAQYIVGEFMPHIGRTTENAGLVAVHIGLGGFILAIIIAAIAWRLLHPVPQLPDLPTWQRITAAIMHWSLYAMILAMALLGWAATNFRGWNVTAFGIDLPMLASKGDRWAHTAGDVHSLLVNVLLAMVALHAGAALFHHFVKRDAVMRRILP